MYASSAAASPTQSVEYLARVVLKPGGLGPIIQVRGLVNVNATRGDRAHPFFKV